MKKAHNVKVYNSNNNNNNNNNNDNNNNNNNTNNKDSFNNVSAGTNGENKIAESKVCTISFERPVNYLCEQWHIFPPK